MTKINDSASQLFWPSSALHRAHLLPRHFTTFDGLKALLRKTGTGSEVYWPIFNNNRWVVKKDLCLLNQGKEFKLVLIRSTCVTKSASLQQPLLTSPHKPVGGNLFHTFNSEVDSPGLMCYINVYTENYIRVAHNLTRGHANMSVVTIADDTYETEYLPPSLTYYW